MPRKLTLTAAGEYTPPTVLGLATIADPDFGVEASSDYEIILYGMYHSCDTPESALDSVHGALYDALQVGSADLREGDTIHFPGGEWGWQKLDMPAFTLVVRGFHVERLA